MKHQTGRLMPDSTLHNHSQDFISMMRVLERGITVDMIMTDPAESVDAGALVGPLLEKEEFSAFDCFPVRSQDDTGTQVIGAVYRHDNPEPEQTAVEAMRPLHRVPLVGSRDSVDRLIRLMHDMKEYHFLVLHEARISGIVTRSDLDRLPVRLLLISRIVHAEQLMTMILRQHAKAEPSWFDQLSTTRREAVERLQKRAREAGDDLELIECLYLADKLTLVGKLAGLAKVKKLLSSMDKLRNQLMHARDAETGTESLSKMIERSAKLDEAILLMERYLEPTQDDDA